MNAFTGVEALMNSRPLISVGGPERCLSAPESVDERAYNPKKSWRRIQELISNFWKRWMKEWLPLLNIRQKWNEIGADVKVGDLVLAISPESPRAHWLLARVLEVFSGRDVHVRVVKLQVGKDTIVRLISKCVHVVWLIKALSNDFC